MLCFIFLFPYFSAFPFPLFPLYSQVKMTNVVKSCWCCSCVCMWGFWYFREKLITACAVCLLTQLCLTLCDPVDCSLPGSSVRGILQARILEWVAMSSSRESSQSRARTQVSSTAGGFFTIWVSHQGSRSQHGRCKLKYPQFCASS